VVGDITATSTRKRNTRAGPPGGKPGRRQAGPSALAGGVAVARCALVALARAGARIRLHEIRLEGVGLPVLPYTAMAEIIVAQPCPCEKLTVIMPFTPTSLTTSPQKVRVSARPFCGAGRINVTSVTGELTEPVN